MGLLNNDVVSTTWRGICFGQRIILTHHWAIIGDYNAATSVTQDLDDIKANISLAGANDKTTPYLAVLPASYTLEQLRVQRIKATRSVYRVTNFIGAVGTNAGAATVACDSAAVTLQSALAGRSRISVKKIGPCPDNVSVAGLLTAAYKALLNNIGSALITAFQPVGSGSVVTPIVYHRSTGTFDALSQFVLGDQSRTQNRRVVGRGE